MKITLTVFKCGLALEAELNKKTTYLQKHKQMSYLNACVEAKKLVDPVAYVQIINTEYEGIDLKSLGAHLAKEAPWQITTSD